MSGRKLSTNKVVDSSFEDHFTNSWGLERKKKTSGINQDIIPEEKQAKPPKDLQRKCARSDSRPLQDSDMLEGTTVDKILEAESIPGTITGRYDNFFVHEFPDGYENSPFEERMVLLRATSPIAIGFDLGAHIFTFISVFLVTLRSSFQIENLSTIIYVADFVYFLLIMSKLTTSQLNLIKGTENVLQTSVFQRVVKKKSFWRDIVSLFPWEIFSGHTTTRTTIATCRILVRLIRIRAPTLLEQLYPSIMLTTIWLVVYILFFGHIVGCVWHAIVYADSQALFTATSTSNDIDRRDIPGKIYTASYKMGVYLLLGMDRDGLCQDSDILLLENTLLCFAAPFGALIHATIFGQISQLIAKSQSLERQHIEQKMAIEKAINTLALPDTLRLRIMSFILYQQIHRSHVTFTQLFQLLSQQLKFELNVALYHDLVRHSGLFLNASNSFIKAVVLCLVDHIFLANDFICRVGEEGLEMYFVVKGSVTIFSKLGVPVTTLITGATFGEVSLLTGSRRNAFVRADTYVVLAILGKEHFEPIVERFPVEMSKILTQVSKDRRRSQASMGSSSNFSGSSASAKIAARKLSFQPRSSMHRNTLMNSLVSSRRSSTDLIGETAAPFLPCPTFSAGELRRASLMSSSSSFAIESTASTSMPEASKLFYDTSKRRFTKEVTSTHRRMSDGTVPEGRCEGRLSSIYPAPETTTGKDEDEYQNEYKMRPIVEAFRDLENKIGHIQGLIQRGTNDKDSESNEDDETIL